MAGPIMEPLQMVAQGNFEFSLNLLQALQTSGGGGNFVFSPFGLGLVLIMARIGGKGKTADELDSLLHLRGNREEILKGYSDALKDARIRQDDYNLSIASRIFADNHVHLSEGYEMTVQKTLNTQVELLDLKKSVDSANRINFWVKEASNGRALDLVSAESLKDDTMLLLTNVIYFHGNWQDRFEAVNKGEFHVTETETTMVDMMYTASRFPYGDIQKIDAKVVALPYKGDRFSLFIYVPNSINGLNKMLQDLGSLHMEEIKASLLYRNEVHVHLPKFKIDSSIEFTQIMKQLNVSTLFSSEADLSDMLKADSSGAKISNVLQKAFIEVTERGTEAGAASGLKAVMLSLRREDHIKADRPFYFQIFDFHTGMVLFSGVLRNPNLQS